MQVSAQAHRVKFCVAGKYKNCSIQDSLSFHCDDSLTLYFLTLAFGEGLHLQNRASWSIAWN